MDSRLATVAGTGHPDAARVVSAVREFVGSGAIPSIDQVYQLKVGLARWRPAIWRRVLVPATITLGDLHAVIQILFGWGGDHLHMFEVGGSRYSDPFFDLGRLEMDDESDVRLREVFAGTAKIRYEYDFGASWWHEIVLERTGEREPGTVYPRCTGSPATPRWSTGPRNIRRRRSRSISSRPTETSPGSTTPARRTGECEGWSREVVRPCSGFHIAVSAVGGVREWAWTTSWSSGYARCGRRVHGLRDPAVSRPAVGRQAVCPCGQCDP